MEAVDFAQSQTGNSILLELALQFGAVRALDELVPLVLSRIVTLLRAERAFFALVDGRGEITEAVTHNLPWSGPPEPLPASMRAVTTAIETRRTVTAARGMDNSASQRLYGLNLVVAVPVLVHQTLVGVMYLDSRVVPRDDIAAYRDLLSAVASLVGVAVENARLFEEQRFRQRMLAWMVHEFRNPLTTIAVVGEILQEEDVGDLRVLGVDVSSASRRISRMIDSTLALSRVDHAAGSAEPSRVGLAELARQHTRDLTLVARSRGLRLTVASGVEDLSVTVVPDRVDIALANLLFNAIKHAYPNTVVQVSLRRRPDIGPLDTRTRRDREAAVLFARAPTFIADPAEGFVEVSVFNEGVEISNALRAVLFTPFAHGDNAPESGQTSTGLGLSIVAECVRSVGGAAWLERSDAAGTCFAFTVPIRSTSAR